MAKQEMCREITAEQAYQEDFLEHEYRTSGTPDFLKRAEVMQRTFEARMPNVSSSENKTFAHVAEKSLF